MRALARYAWAAPASLIGLVVALLTIACGGRMRLADGVIEAHGGRLATAVARRCRFCAITFGHVVLATDACAAERCRAHERVHVRQYERWGALFFVAYVASSAWQALAGGDAYRDNRFEREARHAAGD